MRYITVIISVFSFLFAFYTYFALLPLKQADVVFSQDDLKVEQSSKGTLIVPIIRNIGAAEAEEIKFTIYAFPSQPTLIYNEGIVHSLQAGTTAIFDKITVAPTTNISVGDDFQYILVMHLRYKDSLFYLPFIKTHKNKIFIYKIKPSNNFVSVLISGEYQKLKDVIIDGIKNSQATYSNDAIRILKELN